MSATPAALRFDRARAAQVGLLLAVAISLHVVPQWLAPWFDPALTMIALMTLDALVFAAVMRSPASWRTAAALAAIFLVELAVRRQHVAALPSVVLNLALAAVFGSTLLPGRTPLVQAIAAHALGREAFEAAFAQYLRRVTVAWTAFFLLMAAASAVLALAAPFAWWSLFANVLFWPLIALMFVAEYAWRRLRHPQLPAHTPLQTIASALSFPAAAARQAFAARR